MITQQLPHLLRKQLIKSAETNLTKFDSEHSYTTAPSSKMYMKIRISKTTFLLNLPEIFIDGIVLILTKYSNTNRQF